MTNESDRSADAERHATFMLSLYGSQEPQELIPAPWPELTGLAELNFRHKAGIIARRGSREAEAGRDVAVHAAHNGVPTVLFTGCPPGTIPDRLAVEQTANPTAHDVNAAAQRVMGGVKPAFVVIERYERLRPDRSWKAARCR